MERVHSFNMQANSSTQSLPVSAEARLLLLSVLQWGFPLLLLLIWHHQSNQPPSHAPYLKASKSWNGLPKSYNKYMEEGYRRFKESMFSVPTDSGPLLILPQKFVDEVKVLPDTHASFRKSFEFWFLNAHTNIGGGDEHQLALINAAKHHLTKHRDLEQLLSAVQEELEYAFSVELPECSEWTEVQVYPIMIRLIARLIARVFVGPELCRDEDYLDISITYTINCLRVSRILAWCPPSLRPLLKYAVPGYLSLRRQEERMLQLLTPVIDRRIAETAQDEKASNKPVDLLQWFIDGSRGDQKGDHRFLAISQINASLAAIHSTAIVATNAVFDIATRPHYMDPLRDEIMSLTEGECTSAPIDMRLLSLPKLDSFMKESQRMNPLGLIGIMRMSTADITLSDGCRIPKNSQFAFAMKSMSSDESLWDAADQFDGFRFERLGQSAADAADNHWRFVSSNKQSYSFGYGSHACPGRFFAAMELKVILANLLLRYDARSDSTMEYKTGVRGFMFLPNATQTLTLKRRFI